jgi:hypothetical protein
MTGNGIEMEKEMKEGNLPSVIDNDRLMLLEENFEFLMKRRVVSKMFTRRE